MGKPKAPKYTPASDINLKADLENAAKENEAAYANMEELESEFRNKFNKYLPDDFDYIAFFKFIFCYTLNNCFLEF